MANDKQNNVRILQSTQKKSFHPAVHAVWGFFAGAAFISAAVLLYINLNHQTVSTTALQHDFALEENVALTHAQNALNQNIPQAEHETQQAAEVEEVNAVADQQFDGDLLNAFKHEKAAKTNVQRNAPFKNVQPKLSPTVTAQQPSAQSKRNTAPTVSAESKPSKLLTVKSPAILQAAINEPEIPSPRGSLQVTVTKTLQPLKDSTEMP